MPTFRFYNFRKSPDDYAEVPMEDNVFNQREACRCSESSPRDGCDGKWLMLPYATLCRALDFDPWLPVLFRYDDNYFRVVYPWQRWPPGLLSPPGRPESSFGVRSDYDTAENHFGWVDHTSPVIAIPMHRYYTESPGLIQLMQPIMQGDMGDHYVPAKPIVNVVIDTSVVGGNE